jgi:DNA-binding CsgD family transcriptional regulator
MSFSLDHFTQWNSSVSNALKCLHTTEFPTALISAIKTLIYTESMIVCLEKKGLPPTLLASEGVPLVKENLLLDRYFTMIYLIDPFCLAVENGLSEGFYHITDIAPDDFFDSEYYKSYYVKSDTKEDCYFIIDIDQETKISICIYHNKHDYSYSKEEILFARSTYSLIKELALMVWKTSNLNVITEENSVVKSLGKQIEASFNKFGSDILTAREREVAHLILRGHSSKSAARELSISPGTVQEHRKKIYFKLDISSQAELFSFFIDYISSSDEQK